MGMKVSSKGLAHIAASEGIVVAPYLDSVGVMTYGIGHTAMAGEPDPAAMTKGNFIDIAAEIKNAFELFAVDIQKYEARVNDAVKVDVLQHEFDALVSFDYNTGGIYKASFVKRLNLGDITGATSGFMSWSKPKEIIPRRRAEQYLFSTGEYSQAPASVWGVRSGNRVDWSKPLKTVSPAELVEILDRKKPTNNTGLASLFTLVAALVAAVIAKLGGLF